jgi:hypothetical protein
MPKLTRVARNRQAPGLVLQSADQAVDVAEHEDFPRKIFGYAGNVFNFK